LAVVSLPILHQPFTASPGDLPIQIVAKKFVELSDLLSTNILLAEPKPKLLFNGCLVLTLPNAGLDAWMEAFSVCTSFDIFLSKSMAGFVAVPAAHSPYTFTV